MNSYWTFVTQLKNDDLNWEKLEINLKNLEEMEFMHAGKLTYDEPYFKNLNF